MIGVSYESRNDHTHLMTKYLIVFLLCFFTYSKVLNASEEDFSQQLNPVTYDLDHVKKINIKELECVKRVLWFEARNQSDKGIKAVLSVHSQ